MDLFKVTNRVHRIGKAAPPYLNVGHLKTRVAGASEGGHDDPVEAGSQIEGFLMRRPMGWYKQDFVEATFFPQVFRGEKVAAVDRVKASPKNSDTRHSQDLMEALIMRSLASGWRIMSRVASLQMMCSGL